MTENHWDGQAERRKLVRASVEGCTNNCASQLETYVTAELKRHRAGQREAFQEMLTNQTTELKVLIESAYPDGAAKHREAHQKQIDDDNSRKALKKLFIDKILAGLVTFLMVGAGFVGNSVWESIKREAQRVETKK